MLMKKALKGELPLIAAAKQLQDEIMSPSLTPPDEGDGVLAAERRAVRRVQEGGAAGGRHGDAALRREARRTEQEVLAYLADLVIDAYASESAVLRAIAAAMARRQMPRCTSMPRRCSRTKRPAASS